MPELKSTKDMTIISGIGVSIGPQAKPQAYAVIPVDVGRKNREQELVLLAVHYYTHVLGRYPREDSKLDAFGMNLREYVSNVIEQGIWPGSDLLRYAGVLESCRLAKPDEVKSGREVHAVLYRSLDAEDIDLTIEPGPGVTEDEMLFSVICVFQYVTSAVREPAIELLDKALRYLRMFIGEGANYGSMAAARSLANRAFRESGGRIG